jgi:alpha-amylase
MRNRILLSLFAAASLLAAPRPALAQTTVKKVVLQGFWWDYTNSNYRNKWADYLVELAPRLKELGIDAVWIPPTPKNNGGTNSVGYAPFDNYDLGDKYQKGSTRTRVGTKDELLRLVAVLHANGIEVVQDVVLNHVDGAGTSSGAGGLDPNTYSVTANGGFKNFRNASFATPVPEAGDNAAAYLARSGRWPKNYTNFHAHLGHNTTSGDFANPAFGPDFCYGDDGGSDGYGPSTNASYNPPQSAGYSRNQARSWVQWMKKQTGVDGFRWDAVKHFSYPAQQDWSYNLKYLTGFANGGETMLNTGEFVGNKNELDAYVSSVSNSNGGSEFLMGTFDFSLRGAIYNMVAGGGNYDLAQLPGAQQNQRVAYYSASNTYVHRTAPFVNSHDTFRPQLNAAGNYAGWNSGQELGAHIEPNDVRLSAAYAINLAVDGNPHIFIEDLFNLGYLGNRFSHLPTDAAALPVRADLANLIWCHQHLNFKAGAYFVRQQSADHLVIERGGRALIGINDNWNTWQNATVTTSFAPGTVLKDYSGANGTATRTVGAGGVVSISTAPCDGTAALGRRGYSVWAPVGQDGSPYTPGRAARTTQEWEMADDLGASNCRGLGQGGALPTNSTAWRTAGKIFAKAGQAVNYTLYPENNTTNTRPLIVAVYDQLGNQLNTNTGTTTITGTYTPASDRWLTLKIRNANAAQAGQRAYVQVSYEGPAVVDTRLAGNDPQPSVAIWSAAAGTTDASDCRNWEQGLLPSPTTDVRIPGDVALQPTLSSDFLFANNLTLDAGATLTVQPGATVQLFGNFLNEGTLGGAGTYVFTGLADQRLGGSGVHSFGNLTIANPNGDVALDAPVTVRDTLRLNDGRLALDNFDLTLGSAIVLGGSAGSYVLTPNNPASGGLCQRQIPGNVAVSYPVGSATGFAPLTLTSGTAITTGVRTFDGVFTTGNGGPPYALAHNFVNRTWAMVSGPTAGGFPGTAVAQWNAGEENASFQRSQSAAHYTAGGTSWQLRSPGTVAATGANPYSASLTNIPFGGYLAVGNFTALATRTTAGPALLGISPNPSPGSVRLSNTSGAAMLTLRLTSVLGQEVLPATTGSVAEIQAQLNMALAKAAPGVYLVTVQAGSHHQHLRLVRE